MKLYPNVTYIFIIWLATVLLIAYFGFSTLPHSGKFDNNFWASLSNWDGGHYLGIAESGYSEKFQYAFFPLYPLVIKAVTQITKDYLISAILVSSVSAYFGMQLLFKLVSIYFDKKIAEKTIMAILFFPTSFFFLTAYSEGLFFFLTVAFFYFLGKNNLIWATIMAALASATRLVGLAIVIGLWFEIFTNQGINRKNWYVLFAPLGLVLYCIYLNMQTNDPFYFITAEDHWQRTLSTPVLGFWATLNNTNLSNLLDLFFAVFGVGFAIRAFRFLSPSLAIYSLLAVGIPLFSPTLTSIPRFLVVIFPLFILIALIKNYYLGLAYQIISTAMLAIFTAQFILGFWVS